METIGRHSTLHGYQESKNLKVGLDFRKPEYRREVFLRFYEFHLKYNAHPGCVYYLFPYIKNSEKLDLEQMLWIAFINGCTQNPVTTWIIFNWFPELSKIDIEELTSWFNDNWSTLEFDMDRRYQKKEFPSCVSWYQKATDGSQFDFFHNLIDGQGEAQAFETLWKKARKDFPSMGRLSSFSYLEYLRIIGVPIDCNNLFLEDIDGSASHRNGLAIVLGRDDLDFHKRKPEYTPEQLDWLKLEASTLLSEAKERINSKDVSYFTLESALCTYKSWHRPNRRYPNVYNDMLYNRINNALNKWPEEEELLSIFWKARNASIPEYLRLEDSPNDPGLAPEKQNHYRLTGQVIMMSKDFPEFDNEFDRRVMPV